MESQRKLSGSTEVSSMVDDWKGDKFRQDNLKVPSYGWDGFLRENPRIYEHPWLGLPHWIWGEKISKKENCTLMFGKNEPERLGIRERFWSHRPSISLQGNKNECRFKIKPFLN